MKLLGTFSSSRSLNQISGAPQISPDFSGWGSSILLVKIIQQIVDGFSQDIVHQIPFHGIVQPLSPKQLILKPEGERAWTWLQIHIQANSPVKLNTNDRLIYNGLKYKVMNQLDYSANNYIEIHCVQDFQ